MILDQFGLLTVHFLHSNNLVKREKSDFALASTNVEQRVECRMSLQVGLLFPPTKVTNGTRKRHKYL